MITIKINIEVDNHKEVLEKNKGKMVASLMGSSQLGKDQVESEIKKVIVSSLKDSIEKGLKENGVIGAVSVI